MCALSPPPIPICHTHVLLTISPKGGSRSPPVIVTSVTKKSREKFHRKIGVYSERLMFRSLNNDNKNESWVFF